jgi:hypothetical protein
MRPVIALCSQGTTDTDGTRHGPNLVTDLLHYARRFAPQQNEVHSPNFASTKPHLVDGGKGAAEGTLLLGNAILTTLTRHCIHMNIRVTGACRDEKIGLLRYRKGRERDLRIGVH